MFPGIALFAWGTEQAASGGFEGDQSWRTELLYSLAPPWAVTAFFAGCTLVVIALLVHQIGLKLRRPIVLVADDQGITTFKGARPLMVRWSEIEDLLESNGFLQIVGRIAGRRVTLKVFVGELDVPRLTVLEAITTRRPDLLASIVRNANAA